jgi:hypothetical protein
MNKPLSSAELALVAVPIAEAPKPAMTKRQKLLRLAEIARAGRRGILGIRRTFGLFYDLEHRTLYELEHMATDGTVFEAAAADPALQQAGLKAGSLGESFRFFQLTRSDMHAFACGCDGAISNEDMARRIESLARGC